MSSATRRYVDMWAFLGMHPSNLEILQQLKSADDRQFGANMDVCGTISELDPKTGQWNKTFMAGIRSDIWTPDKAELEKSLKAIHGRRAQKQRGSNKSDRRGRDKNPQPADRLAEPAVEALSIDDIEKRRLVTKLFRTTGKNIRWVGTMEELTTREVHNSLGSKHPMLSLMAILSGHEYLTLVQQNHRTFRLPPIYTLCFHDERTKRTWYVNIKRKWFSIGADYVLESAGKKIGEIDGKLIGFGYNAYVTVTEPTLAANSDFMDLVTLFATTVGYHRAMRRSIRRRVAAARNGNSECHVIEDEELWLLKNPRRRAA